LTIDKPTRSYTGLEWFNTRTWNKYTVAPVDKKVVNQVVGHVAFSEVTTYYIRSTRHPPSRRPVGDQEVVTVVQALKFYKKGPNDSKHNTRFKSAERCIVVRKIDIDPRHIYTPILTQKYVPKKKLDHFIKYFCLHQYYCTRILRIHRKPTS
jgi:hypothetical protein